MFDITLQKIERQSDDVSTFWFTKPEGWTHIAGQFVELTITHDMPDNRGQKRWFTLSSSPTEPLLGITTKRHESMSTFKQLLFGLAAGEHVTISQPMGDFVLPMHKDTPILFVTAGIGITPIRSMLTYLSDMEQSRTIAILYKARGINDLLFQQAMTGSGARLHPYISQQGDTLDAQVVLNHAKQFEKPYIYISGPEAFTEQLFHELKEAGASTNRLVTDYFHGYN